MEIKYDFTSKDEMIKKLQDYATNPDDDNIRIKEKIRELLLRTPELLYALNDGELEPELFDKDGNLNVDENGEPLGEWSRYFGESASIRPALMFPETQTHSKNYVSYQVSFNSLLRNNDAVKNCIVSFYIFVRNDDLIEKNTGIPRHDLIASIIREKFAWSGIATGSAVPEEDAEGVTDTNYVTRTLKYKVVLPNSLSITENGFTRYNNKWNK